MKSAFLLKAALVTAPETYATVGGFRLTAEERSKQRIVISGSGVFTGSAAEQRVKAAALSGQIDDYQVQFESGETIAGRFQIARLDYAGDFNGERTYAIVLEGTPQ